MENSVEEVKRRLDIVEYIGSFITLKKAGRNFKAICPFHQEKTPSFVISPDRQIWHCFGACQEGGDAIKFLMKWENITFYEALKELADKFGVKLSHITYEDSAWKKRERLLGINLLAAEFFDYVLRKTRFGNEAQEYLKNRLIDEKIAKKFQLGYAPASWDSLLKFLKKKHYEANEIFATGLLVKDQRGTFYDRFRGRLMFPLIDARNNILGFSGRSLDQKEKSAKYINTPETSLYHKRETLFGINTAKESIKKAENVFLVEGEFDVISPYQNGIENIVAIKGSAVTREQLMLLKRYTGKITLTLDSDVAGEEAMKRGIEEAENLDFDLKVVLLDFAKDPDEAVQKDSSRFKKLLNVPIPIYDFIIDLARKKYPGDDPFNKKRVGEESVEFIEKIRNPIVQSHYVKKLAGLLNVSESSIEALIRKTRQKIKQRAQPFKKINIEKKEPREILIQKHILSMLFQSDNSYELANKIFANLNQSDFSIPSYQKIVDLFLSEKKFDPQKFVQKLPAELIPVFDEIYLFSSSDLAFENENLDKLILELRRYSFKRQIAKIAKEMIIEENKEKLKELSRRLNEVEKMLTPL